LCRRPPHCLIIVRPLGLEMATILDPMDIYDRGLRDLSCLQGPDRLVFMLHDFDNLMEMEGWDHFFLYEHHFFWYSEMKDWLRTIGDKASLAVLQDFESHVRVHGVALVPPEFESFLNAGGDAYLRTGPDWRMQYCELRPARWAQASAYLEGQGLRLLTASIGEKSGSSNKGTSLEQLWQSRNREPLRWPLQRGRKFA
jgi:hypothetical protein